MEERWLTIEQIYEQLEYLSKLCDTSVDSENPHALSFFIEKLTSCFGNASYILGSARYRYDEKKSPATTALKTWAEELTDKLGKRMNALQSVMNVAREEKKSAGFQPY